MKNAKEFFDNYDCYVAGKNWGIAYNEQRKRIGNHALGKIKAKLEPKK